MTAWRNHAGCPSLFLLEDAGVYVRCLGGLAHDSHPEAFHVDPLERATWTTAEEWGRIAESPRHSFVPGLCTVCQGWRQFGEQHGIGFCGTEVGP